MKNSITAVCMRMRLRIDRSIAKFFGIGAFCIKRTLGMERDKENAKHRDGTALSLDEEQLETLRAAIEVCPDATLVELQRLIADQCKVTVSQISICRALKQLHLPFGKGGSAHTTLHSIQAHSGHINLRLPASPVSNLREQAVLIADEDSGEAWLEGFRTRRKRRL